MSNIKIIDEKQSFRFPTNDDANGNFHGDLSQAFVLSRITGVVSAKIEGRSLLRFWRNNEIDVLFDASLPDGVAALTIVRASRMPQNFETGSLILLNPHKTVAELADGFMRELAGCRLRLEPVAVKALAARALP